MLGRTVQIATGFVLRSCIGTYLALQKKPIVEFSKSSGAEFYGYPSVSISFSMRPLNSGQCSFLEDPKPIEDKEHGFVCVRWNLELR